MTTLSAGADGRSPKSAKARNRGRVGGPIRLGERCCAFFASCVVNELCGIALRCEAAWSCECDGERNIGSTKLRLGDARDLTSERRISSTVVINSTRCAQAHGLGDDERERS